MDWWDFVRVQRGWGSNQCYARMALPLTSESLSGFKVACLASAFKTPVMLMCDVPLYSLRSVCSSLRRKVQLCTSFRSDLMLTR